MKHHSEKKNANSSGNKSTNKLSHSQPHTVKQFTSVVEIFNHSQIDRAYYFNKVNTVVVKTGVYT